VSDFTLVEETHFRRVFVRAWEPGDGIVCAFAKAAPRELPCSEPVAVVLSEAARPSTGRYSRSNTLRRVVCRNHAPGLARPHEVNADAKRAATERLIVEHWETYQGYVEEATRARQDKELEFADPQVRRLVLGEDGAE
jgi:hypothetical protein